jgi:tetratricopeptide (TPR) repeat protein
VAAYSRIQRQQLLQEVEGYLDLAMVLSDRYPLSATSRNRIANRALETLERLEQKTRESGIGLHLQGQAYRVMERYDDAVGPLLAAREAEPENVHISLALGWCYKRLDRIDSAIQALEDALAVCPDEAIIHYNLACYWSLANNVPLALVYLSQSFDLDPKYRDIVAEEVDFDPLRNHPEFVALTSVIV